jgi:hypothetical protein
LLKKKLIIKDKMDENICNICCENYSKKIRGKIECCFCNFSACKDCYENYLLTINYAKCMNNDCDKFWTRKFMTENFSKHFIITKYKKHLEKIFFDKEKSLLPATQEIVEEIIKKENITNENIKINKMLNKLYKLQYITNQILEMKKDHDLDEYIQEYMDSYFINIIYNLEHSKMKETNITIKEKMAKLYEMIQQNDLLLLNDSNKKIEKKQFIRKCGNYLCRGFLSTQWKCGICEKYTCKE